MLRRFESYSLHAHFFSSCFFNKMLKFSYNRNIEHIATLDFSSDLSLIDFTLDQLIESDFHLGCKFNQFNKLNFSYIFAKRFNFLIINLAYSLFNLKLAVYFTSIIVSRRGKVLFYDGGFESMRLFVRFIGLTSKQYSVGQKWIAGLLTNFKDFYPAVFTGISRHFRFPKVNFSGMRYIHRPPNLFCSLNIDKGSASFLENFRLGIPVIALVDVSTTISGVTFPIFSNSVSPHTHMTFFSILRSAVLNGYKHEIYKFYRKSIKNIIRIRYLRYFLSRRQRRLTVFFQFRLFFLRLIHDHSFIFIKFLKFFLYPLFPNVENLNIQKNVEFIYANFYEQNPGIRSVILVFMIKYLYPFFKNVFFSDISSKFSNGFFNKVYLAKCSFNDFLILFISFFRTESSFLNFFFNFFGKLQNSFLKNDFSSFINIFFTRVLPFFLFLFRIFLQLDITITEKYLIDFFKSIKIFALAFSSLKLGSLLEAFHSNIPSTLRFYFLHECFPFFKYQKVKMPDLRLFFFSKFLKFKLLNVPLFTSFNHMSFNNLVRIIGDFTKNYGFFSYLKFSKKCKRFLRRFSRSKKFLKFLFNAVYKKKKGSSLFFDLKISRFVSLPMKFIRLNENKSFFRQRYVDLLLLYDSDLYTRRFFKKVRYKFNSFLLAFFDEEYDDSKFPMNNEFFYFQVGYGSAFLKRQYQRNKQLKVRRFKVQEGGLSMQPNSFNFLRKKFKISRIVFYFFFNVNSYQQKI